jgi:hypothetical protein
MPSLRFQPPDRLPGAANFSKDESLRGSLNAVKLVKSQKWVWDELRQACELEKHYARKREPGHWELAAVAFVASRQVDIQPFWDESTSELWKACGFDEKPPYMRVWRRLRELESVCDEFLTAAAAVIQRCKSHDSRVMAHVHFDWTEDETHAALVHDCQKGEDCAYKKKGGGRGWGHAIRPERVSVKTAREERHALAEEDLATATKREKASAPEKTKKGDGFKRVRINGCWYRTRDTEAGIRAYTGPRGCRRFWHGFYGGKAICHWTGGVIPSVDSASIQEHKLFIGLYDRTKEMAGEAPETAIADRAISISDCFQHATKNGTAPIFPWRKPNKNGTRHDHETHDRHGVKRCKHCGGDMEQVRFSKNDGKPRLWFRCILQFTAECAKEQTIACEKDWRMLIPLSRTESLYHELKESHRSYEATHDYWRDRYKVAADTLAIRPKVVSLDWHRLRANVACLVDWLRIAAKNGWLGTVRAKKRHQGTREFMEQGAEAATNLGNTRARLGLAAAYGAVAKALGLGEAEPPSRRKHPWKPPPQPVPASP